MSKTRNARLTAIRSFFQFAALKAPECAEQIARVLSIPEKRYESTLINYLTDPEIDALLAAPDRSTRTGRRDHALLLLAVQTGLRASELASLRRQDLNLGGGWVRCQGKGRKERCTPLSRAARQVLRVWLREHDDDPAGPLFPSRTGGHLTRSGIWRLVAKHAARGPCPVSVAGGQEHHPAHAATHRGDAAAARSRPRVTPRRSRSGSGMRRSIPPTSTCTPTWSSNGALSTAPRRPTPSPAATDHPTRCSRFLESL